MIVKRGSRPKTSEEQLRINPKRASGLTEYRKASIESDIERGLIKEGLSYESSRLNKMPQNIHNASLDDEGLKRSAWLPGSDGRSYSSRETSNAVGAIVHSASHIEKEVLKASTLIKQSTLGSSGVGSVGVGTSAGSSYERLAPEVYSPLFTMANLNLPRDKLTINAWCRNFFQLHPIVRNAITLHSTYPISKLNLKCQDKRVLDFFETMIEEMDLVSALSDISLEYWKLGEKIKGSSLITMADGSVKPIAEIEIGDIVLTHLGNKKKVINKFIKPTNVVKEEHLKVYKISVVGLPESLIISGKHPILHTSLDNIKCDTPSCNNKKIRILPRRKQCSNCRKIHNRDISPEFIETNNIKINDIVYSPFNSDEEDNFNSELCYIMGFWLAEGCYCKSKKDYDGIKFTSYDKKFIDDNLSPLLKKCFGFSGTTYVSRNSNKCDHLLRSKKRNGHKIAEFFMEHCGEYSKEKQLSETIMSLPIELQKHLLAGFIDGDGCIDQSNGHIIISTSSKNLANQFTLMLRRLGIHPTCSKINAKDNISDKYRIKIVANESYKFKTYLKTNKNDLLRETKWCSPNSSLYKNWQMLSIKKVEDITNKFNENFMYDIEVEDDHSYVANGVAVHNCFPFAELNENTGKWSKIVIQNPDYVHVKKTVLSGDPIITLKPDAVLQRLVFSNNPADSQLRKQIPEKILYHIRAGQDIPLDNFNISHLKILSSPYDVRGTSIIVSVFKDLMLYDKLRECFPVSTEVLTKDGFKFYDDISKNDEIATMNQETGELEFQKYINRTDYEFNGELYHFYGKKIDIMVTPNHRMWLAKKKTHYNGYNDFQFVRAEDVKKGCFYKSKASIDKYVGKEISNINLFDQKIPIEDYLEFLGYMISEGCIHYNNKTQNYKISICQNNNSKDYKYIKKSIIKIADMLNLHCGEYVSANKQGYSSNNDITTWSISRKIIAEHFMNEIGYGSGNKHVPFWTKQLSPRLLKILLNALVKGDGSEIESKYKNGSTAYRYNTISKRLADDIQEIVFKCGYAPHLIVDKNGYGKEFYLITWSDSNYGKEPVIYGNNNYNGASIEKIPYNGRVFCFEVSNGLFITRNNGLMTIQGNSKFAQADGMINPVTLIKVGGNTEGEYRATQEDLEFYRQMFEEAQYDKDAKIITHAGVTVERVGFSGQVLDIASDLEFITKNIYTGLMVPPAVIDTESAVYSSASIGLEVLRQRYFNFRNMIARWLINKIFAPISEIQGFYEYRNKEKHLIVPEIEWNQMNLYDLQDYISNITGMVSAGQASVQSLYKSLGISYEDEKIKMRREAIDKAIKMREENSLSGMSLTELRSLDPEKPIMEPIDSKERSQMTPPEAGGDLGMGGTGGMGGVAPGGLPELAPPPGEMVGGGGAEGGGMTPPPLGPGAGV